MEKQPACAAAISSSGFVPTPSSKRVLNEYCVSFSTPLSVEIVPLPSLSPPFHCADAFRFMMARTLYDSVFHVLQMERQRLEVDAQVDALHLHVRAQAELHGREV